MEEIWLGRFYKTWTYGLYNDIDKNRLNEESHIPTYMCMCAIFLVLVIGYEETSTTSTLSFFWNIFFI